MFMFFYFLYNDNDLILYSYKNTIFMPKIDVNRNRLYTRAVQKDN